MFLLEKGQENEDERERKLKKRKWLKEIKRNIFNIYILL